MALKPQLSFSSGELDPILDDRVTLERFQNALATARNTMIGKSGTIKSRFSKYYFSDALVEDKVNIYCAPGTGRFIECGIDPINGPYVAVYDFDGTLLHIFDGTLGAGGAPFFDIDTLYKLHFVTSGKFVFIFGGAELEVYGVTIVPLYEDDSFDWNLQSDSYFLLPSTIATNVATSSDTGTGYEIEYAWTAVYEGQETEPKYLSFSPINQRPITVGEENELIINVGSDITLIDSFNEIRIYQRPYQGGAYGFLGRTTEIYVDGVVVKAKFVDLGADPDYTNGIPILITREGLSSFDTLPQNEFLTGTIYQQRMLLGNCINANEETILASRPGYKNNFYRDFPYSADSALNFKAGTTGNAKVLRMIESDGLVVFTSAGVYVNQGVLNVDNLAMTRRGPWIIDVNIPPLVIPGGLFFVDKTTSTVRQLVYSQEIASYDSVEQSIFSDHLFREKTITSWCFQEGSVAMIIVCFSDGTFATFSYSFEHQLRAWTRHDSVYPVEQVEGTGIADTSIFVINKNGVRQIEFTSPRTIPSSVFVSNPEAKITGYGAFMDGYKVMSYLINDGLLGTDELVLDPVVALDWEGDLTLTCGSSLLFTSPGLGEVGTILRFFHPVDKTRIDLTVASRTDSNEIVVTPSEEFPSAYATGFRLYETHNIIEGLDHLEGEEVSVICDGDMVSSPYNDNADYTATALVVTGGQITIPENYYSAISIVGRPIVADIKTLNISTAEQSPTMIESLNVNKLYVRVFDSKGLFVSNRFPEEEVGDVDGTSVLGMQVLDDYDVPNGSPILGNRAKQNFSKRMAVTLPGEWDSNGQISLRQVDPFHFEILSIIADIEILKRSDR